MENKEWIAEYKGSTVTIYAKDGYIAKNKAAIEMGVPASRQKHIRIKKGEREC